MAHVWMANYRAWLNAGFDSWDALTYCFCGAPIEAEWGVSADDFVW